MKVSVLSKSQKGTDGVLRGHVPRLSAAITTPSLNLTARTDVPVTMGDWVWVWGRRDWRYDASYGP